MQMEVEVEWLMMHQVLLCLCLTVSLRAWKRFVSRFPSTTFCTWFINATRFTALCMVICNSNWIERCLYCKITSRYTTICTQSLALLWIILLLLPLFYSAKWGKQHNGGFATTSGAGVGNLQMCVEYVYTRIRWCACSSIIVCVHAHIKSQPRHQDVNLLQSSAVTGRLPHPFLRGYHASLATRHSASIKSVPLRHKACIIMNSSRTKVVFRTGPCPVSRRPDTDLDNGKVTKTLTGTETDTHDRGTKHSHNPYEKSKEKEEAPKWKHA